MIGFRDADHATAFERYLKTGSGIAFARKHFARGRDAVRTET